MSHFLARILSVALTQQADPDLYGVLADPGTMDSITLGVPLTANLDWYNSAMMNGSGIENCIQQQPAWENPIRSISGRAVFPYAISGVTKDSVGTPVSNAVVDLFRTSDDQWLRTATSKDGGQYNLGTDDNTTTHYIVGYRTGPDIEGTTVNTLTGS